MNTQPRRSKRFGNQLKVPGRIDNSTRRLGGGVTASAYLDLGLVQSIGVGGYNVGGMAFLRQARRARTVGGVSTARV